jgi:L-asparaginase
MTERTGLRSVSVLALGGTIAATGFHGVAPTLSAEQLVNAVPATGDVARITAHSFRQVASAELTLFEILALAREIESCVAEAPTGQRTC